jgi:hypothetical protein
VCSIHVLNKTTTVINCCEHFMKHDHELSYT